MDICGVGRRVLLVLLAISGSVCCSPSGAAQDDLPPEVQAVDFDREIAPILARACLHCHDSTSRKSGLDLSTLATTFAGGEQGPAVVAHQAADSPLYQRVEADDMPPDGPLPEPDKELLRRWIADGATWGTDPIDPFRYSTSLRAGYDWWAWQPLKPNSIPAIATTPATAAWSSNSIDALVQARLQQHGLPPSPMADGRALLRRLYLTLIGLPPLLSSVDSDAKQGSTQIQEELLGITIDMADFQSNGPTYAMVVDRLLASPHYGERWARHWFDTIHFADSHGYEHDVGREHAWPYRDYVINALNNDLPWDTFIRQQLAVDYFEPDANHLIPALGFLGAGTFDFSTYSTGPVTFDYLDRDDMVTQTMAAFVSTTANCARCHAHKFDPISQEDYYALQSVFAGVLKGDVSYDVDAHVAAKRRRLESLLAAVERGDLDVLSSADSEELIVKWEQQRSGGAQWTPLEVHSYVSLEGATLAQIPEDVEKGVILASGNNPDTDTYIITGTTSLTQASGVRLDLFPHPSLPMNGPGRCHNGNLHLSEIVVTAFLPGQTTGTQVPIARATADFDQEGWGVHRAIDGDVKTAWGIHPAVGQPHHAVFEFAQPLQLPAGSMLTITLKQLHGGSHVIGAFRLTVTDSTADLISALPGSVEEALHVHTSERSAEQRLSIAKHVVRIATLEDLAKLPPQGKVYAVGANVLIPTGNGNSQPASVPSPKMVHLLQRGDIQKPRQEVPPGALAVLQHLPARFTESVHQGEAARRAALADWLAHRDNVLTWRSVVNRVWHYHFGKGLCDTPSDFGRMGGIPTHPELIDWLAVWFRDEAGASLKKLHRLIVTSQTYRQSSMIHTTSAAIDADNRFWWRQSQQRLDADAYRDYVMAVSGRLDDSMGGPAIQHFLQSPGAQLTPQLNYAAFDWGSRGANRRSIYRFVWRGIPDPLMAALDFPDLGLLTPVRSKSISPLQALALYNNHFVLFHSAAMAEHISRVTADEDQQVVAVIQKLFQRDPGDSELNLYRSHLQQHGLASLCRILLNSNEFLFVP